MTVTVPLSDRNSQTTSMSTSRRAVNPLPLQMMVDVVRRIQAGGERGVAYRDLQELVLQTLWDRDDALFQLVADLNEAGACHYWVATTSTEPYVVVCWGSTFCWRMARCWILAGTGRPPRRPSVGFALVDALGYDVALMQDDGSPDPPSDPRVDEELLQILDAEME